MPDFILHVLNRAACRGEVEELRGLLELNSNLREAQLLEFFRTRHHLSALIGLYNPAIARFDRIAWEYPLFGDFRCDLVIGDSNTRAYTFVEVEDATSRSLFIRHGKKATREWSSRFDHGYSQVVDWFYKLQDMTNTDEMEARFGKRSIDYTGVLIVGRDQHMDVGEQLRMNWRREYVIVNSKRIICVKFDQLLVDLLFQLDAYELDFQAGGG
jgi:hypothetical protein